MKGLRPQGAARLPRGIRSWRPSSWVRGIVCSNPSGRAGCSDVERRRLNVIIVVVAGLPLVPAGPCAGQVEIVDRALAEVFGHVPGSAKWVRGCQVSVAASWNEAARRDSCLYSPPPGWVIADHRLHDRAAKNGGLSVDFLDAGLSLIREEEMAAAYELASRNASRRPSGSLSNALRDCLRVRQEDHGARLQEHQAHRNTLRVTVEANGNGRWFRRKAGWSRATVDVMIVFLGSPSPAGIRLQPPYGPNLPSHSSRDRTEAAPGAEPAPYSCPEPSVPTT